MSHLEDRLAEFVFEELSESEMAEARGHVAQCLECQGRVAGLRSIRQTLDQLPEVEVPRRMVFLPPQTVSNPARSRWMPLAWGLPAAMAAALVLVVLAGPVRFERTGGGFVIALGAADEQAPPVAETAGVSRVAVEAPVAATIDYERLDYAQIGDRLRVVEEAWLRSEIARAIATVDAEHGREIQRLRAELQYFSELQRTAQRETYQNASSIQLLAERTGGD